MGNIGDLATKGKIISTIIIIVELNAEMRGYSLKGKEFRLKYPNPIKTEVETLDGCKLVDNFWVISKKEYMRVVPEAKDKDFDTDEIFIPTYVAKQSFRPCYTF